MGNCVANKINYNVSDERCVELIDGSQIIENLIDNSNVKPHSHAPRAYLSIGTFEQLM